MIKKLIEQLKMHEGFSKHVYDDTRGYQTIGFGYCLSHNPLLLSYVECEDLLQFGIDHDRAEELLVQCVDKFQKDLLMRLRFFGDLDDVRKCVLINMAFNLGVEGLLKFKNTLALISEKNFTDASDQMLRSHWAKQVGKRAIELALQMKTGNFAN